MTNRRIITIAANLVAIAVLAAAVLMTIGANGPASSAFELENAERMLGTRARAFQELQVKSDGVALVEREENIKYQPDKTWEGEKPFGPRNDWEPSIAADPNDPWVYVLTTRFGTRTSACANCPNPHLMLKRSNDNGETYKPVQYLCRCPGGGWQYDPIIEVDGNGGVHAMILSKWETLYTRSDDHGRTWTEPVSVENDRKWTDHGFMTVSDDGQDIYAAFNQQRSYVSASHDGGQTWGPSMITNTPGQGKYFYAYYGTVLPDDTVIFALAAVPCCSPNGPPYARGPIQYYVARSTDGGASWSQVLIDEVAEQPPCDTTGCRNDHFAGLAGVASDPSGKLVYTYVGATVPRKGQVTYTTTSTDGGLNWSTPVPVSQEFDGSRRVIAAFPAIAAGGNDDFRLVWMDNRNGFSRWNTWYSRSTDGGMTWSEDELISDAINGAPYKRPNGFLGDYGDYLDVDVMDNDMTIATWGEAFGYYGPGNTWINREV